MKKKICQWDTFCFGKMRVTELSVSYVQQDIQKYTAFSIKMVGLSFFFSWLHWKEIYLISHNTWIFFFFLQTFYTNFKFCQILCRCTFLFGITDSNGEEKVWNSLKTIFTVKHFARLRREAIAEAAVAAATCAFFAGEAKPAFSNSKLLKTICLDFCT